jgi:PPOX class probable F420-dependent enzyme
MFQPSDHTRSRLTDEPIIWMTTVRPDGRPQASPVWFLYEGDEILVFSKKSPRVTNVRTNPAVALNLEGNGEGGDIVTIEGTARLVEDEPPSTANADYVAKYEARMARNGWTPQRFAELYPVAIRITCDRGRAW